MRNELKPIADAIVSGYGRISTAESRITKREGASRGSWKAPALENSWVQSSGYEAVSYTLDSDGMVHIKGVIQSGASGDPCFTLPEGLRPSHGLHAPCKANNGAGYIAVLPSGEVVPQDSGASSVSTWVTLSGCSFRVSSLYDDSSRVLGVVSAKCQDYLDTYPEPRSRAHAGGLIYASGFGKLSSAPASTEVTWEIPNDHCSRFRNIHALSAFSSVSTSGMARYDSLKNRLIYNSGVNSTTLVSMHGACWPSLALQNSPTYCTLGPGVTAYSDKQFQTGGTIYKDDMGQCWLGGISTVIAKGYGTTLYNLPAELWPSSKVLVMAINNDIPIALDINTNGTVTLGQACSAGWISISSTYWIDN